MAIKRLHHLHPLHQSWVKEDQLLNNPLFRLFLLLAIWIIVQYVLVYFIFEWFYIPNYSDISNFMWVPNIIISLILTGVLTYLTCSLL